MAEGKKSFILYADQIHLFENLSDLEAGVLIKHIFRYVNDMNPECDRLTTIAFEPIKQQLKRNLKYWQETKVKRSIAGKLGMESRWNNKNNNDITKITSVIDVKENITNITVNDNVSVNVNDSVIIKKDKKFIPPTFEELKAYCKDNNYEPIAERVFKYYSTANWKDSKGNQVKNWKQKLQGVWFKPENLSQDKNTTIKSSKNDAKGAEAYW